LVIQFSTSLPVFALSPSVGLATTTEIFSGRRIDLDAIERRSGFLRGAQGAREFALVKSVGAATGWHICSLT
jgi:hypothetical protein